MRWLRTFMPAAADVSSESDAPAGEIGLADSGDASSVPRVLISALGEEGAETREAALRHTIAMVAAEGRRPVVCATHLPMALLVEGPAAIELLPLRGDLSVLLDTEYAAYLDRRWEIVLAKWRIEEEITLGQEFAEFRAGQLAATGG